MSEEVFETPFSTSKALAKMMSSEINAGEKVAKILDYGSEE